MPVSPTGAEEEAAVCIAAITCVPFGALVLLFAVAHAASPLVEARRGRMTPEAVAQPKADYLAIDHFSPLSRSPQIRRVAAPWSAATDAPVHWRPQLDDPFGIDWENQKRLLWRRPVRRP